MLNMGYSVSQSLISGQPPLLIFTLCLTAFGLTMVILAYIIGEQDIPNPDVQMDWNKFFLRISDFKLCPVQNHTKASNGILSIIQKNKYESNSVLNSSSRVVDESKSMNAVFSDVVHYASNEKSHKLDLAKISAKVQFKLIGKMHLNSFSQVNGKIKGSLLGFTGKYATVLFNISLIFLFPQNTSCSGENCHFLWDACLMMQVPSDLLNGAKNPEICDRKLISAPNTLPLFFFDESDAQDDDLLSPCITLDYTSNSKLTEMLTLHDRSIVNLHLMHTSYFMFVMVMTLVCYSMIKGRYRSPKNSHSHEKIPMEA